MWGSVAGSGEVLLCVFLHNFMHVFVCSHAAAVVAPRLDDVEGVGDDVVTIAGSGSTSKMCTLRLAPPCLSPLSLNFSFLLAPGAIVVKNTS